jgi:hypothetical protein
MNKWSRKSVYPAIAFPISMSRLYQENLFRRLFHQQLSQDARIKPNASTAASGAAQKALNFFIRNSSAAFHNG